MKTVYEKYSGWAAWLAGALCLFFFYFQLLPFHLFHKEQTQLFLFAAEPLKGYGEYPAALACLLGDFLTQFYYYIGGGPAILTVVLLLWGAVAHRLFLPLLGRYAWLPALLAVVWEAGRQCVPAYPLSATLSLLGGGCVALLCRRQMAGSLPRALWTGMAAVAVAYYLFGYGAWLTALFLFRRKNGWVALLLLAEAAALPAATRRACLFTWKEAYSYPATAWKGSPDLKRERLLALDGNTYFGRTEKVQALLQKEDARSPLATYYYNLLNARQGLLPDRLMAYYQPAAQGLFLPVTPTSSYFTIAAAGEAWFALGDMTMAEHATILSMIFSPRHTGARAVKRLAEINLVNGDEAAALKYLRLLQKTLCYRSWAERRMPGKETEEVRRWLAQKRGLIPVADTLRASGDAARSLRNLLRSHPENRMTLDYLLCYDLLNKDMEAFASDFRRFFPQGATPGRLYAEGLLVYFAGKREVPEGLNRVPIPPQVLQEFREYTRLYEESGGDGTLLRPKYGKSYWFYFHYAVVKREV